jgi:hypothetical protein
MARRSGRAPYRAPISVATGAVTILALALGCGGCASAYRRAAPKEAPVVQAPVQDLLGAGLYNSSLAYSASDKDLNASFDTSQLGFGVRGASVIDDRWQFELDYFSGALEFKETGAYPASSQPYSDLALGVSWTRPLFGPLLIGFGVHGGWATLPQVIATGPSTTRAGSINRYGVLPSLRLGVALGDRTLLRASATWIRGIAYLGDTEGDVESRSPVPRYRARVGIRGRWFKRLGVDFEGGVVREGYGYTTATNDVKATLSGYEGYFGLYLPL